MVERSDEYRAKNRERMRESSATEEGKAYEHKRRRTPKTRYIKARYDAGRRKSGAKPFTISLEEYLIVIARKCEYCNCSLENETGSGLDRIDNEKGYEPGNVNPCCGDCNRRRSKSMGAEEFKEQSRINGYWKE